ncbi:MAG: hypothetical protein SOT15_10550, partial [Treponema sp.]|nr:hypothetical protein [Treponema sp.]
KAFYFLKFKKRSNANGNRPFSTRYPRHFHAAQRSSAGFAMLPARASLASANTLGFSASHKKFSMRQACAGL